MGMGWAGRLAMLLAAVAVPALGCSGKTLPYAGGLMIAVQTDLVAPKDVAAVGLYISSDGKPIFGDTRDVAPDGEVKFPATIAVLADENRPQAVVKIRVVAFGHDGKVRVLRDALTTVPRHRTGLLRTPLLWINEGSGTGSRSDLVQSASIHVLDATSDGFDKLQSTCQGTDQTTIDGECVDDHVDGDTLPDYSDAVVFGGGSADGTGGSCFDVKDCFASTTPLVIDDPVGCTTSFHDGHDPNDPNISFAVALKEDPAGADNSTGECLDNGTCVVPIDKGLGWSIQGTTIKFPMGLCKHMQATHAQGVVTSFACPSKTDAIPACGPASSVSSDHPVRPDGGTPTPPPPVDDGGVIADGGVMSDFETPDMAVLEYAPMAVVALPTEVLIARAGVSEPMPQSPEILGYTYPLDGGAPSSMVRWIPIPIPANPPDYRMALRPDGTDVLLANATDGTFTDCPTAGAGQWECNQMPLDGGVSVAVAATATRAYVSIPMGLTSPSLNYYDFGGPVVIQQISNTMLPSIPASALAAGSGGTGGFVYVGYTDGSVYRCEAPCDAVNKGSQLVAGSGTSNISALAVLEDAAGQRNWIYWIATDATQAPTGIYRLEDPYTFDGSKVPTPIASAAEFGSGKDARALAVDSKYVYWGTDSAVTYRARDAANMQAPLGSLTSYPTPVLSIATTNTSVHWVTAGDAMMNGAVSRVLKTRPF